MQQQRRYDFMLDIKFVKTGSQSVDFLLEGGDFIADDGLENAVLISLFSDRFVSFEDLPVEETDPRGWWGDAISDTEGDQIGSRLWLVDRSKITIENANRLRDFAKESLQWLIDDGVAASVFVETEVVPKEQIDLRVIIVKPEGESFPFKFVWDGQLEQSERAS